MRRSLVTPGVAEDSPLRGDLLEWLDRAREMGMGREDVEALFRATLDQRFRP